MITISLLYVCISKKKWNNYNIKFTKMLLVRWWIRHKLWSAILFISNKTKSNYKRGFNTHFHFQPLKNHWTPQTTTIQNIHAFVIFAKETIKLYFNDVNNHNYSIGLKRNIFHHPIQKRLGEEEVPILFFNQVRKNTEIRVTLFYFHDRMSF